MGETSAPETSSEEALWDPCGLPETALTETGIDPASKEAGIASVDWTDAGWKVCGWDATAGWYFLTIFSGTPTLEDWQARSDFTDYSPTTVGSKRALQFRPAGATKELECHTAVELQQGHVDFSVLVRPSVGAKEDPCAVVGRHAADLIEFLPEK